MQIKSCKTKVVSKVPEKSIIECVLVMDNSLLTLDVLNNKLNGIWLMYDSSNLEHPADLIRVGGMLLRALRGGSRAGDHLAVASNLFSTSSRNNWKETCTEDLESQSRFCVQTNNRKVFNLTLTPNRTYLLM